MSEQTYPATDTDDDGVPDREENDGPNSGDGNFDSVPDSQQGNVASFFTYNGQNPVTLETPAGITLNKCEALDNPSPKNSPTQVDFKKGFFKFTLLNVLPGGCTTARLKLPAGTVPISYYKYGPTPTDRVDHWYEFLFDGETGAEINNNVITLHFVDGKRGDYDLDDSNGIISDPGGPAFEPTNFKGLWTDFIIPSSLGQRFGQHCYIDIPFGIS